MTVRTDNLFIAHYQGSLLEEFHYYPFGMCFEVSKSPTLGKSAAIKYNSQLHEHDEFEDANGNVYGLEDYNFAFRNYDAQIGRWLQPDPLMQHPSPYLAMSNNPVSFTDPSGLFDGTVINNWGDIVYQAGSHTNGYYIMDYSFGFGLSLDGDKSIKSGHYYVTEISAYEFYSRNHERRFLMNQFGNRFNVTMDAGGNYRPMGEAYGEAAARFQENLINGVNAYNSGSAGDLLKGAQGGRGYNIDNAVNWLNDNSLDKSVGRCAYFVRQALVAGGINTNPHPVSAKNYGPYLTKWGFSNVSKTSYSPTKGDIRVFQPYSGGSQHGHIDMFNGTHWLSDFKEKNLFPSAGYKNSTFEIYRWGTYP